MSEESLRIESSNEGSCTEPCARPLEHWSPRCQVNGLIFDKKIAMQQLEAFMDGFWQSQSQRPLEDQQKDIYLAFDKVVITRRMINLLRPLIVGDDQSSSSVDHDNNSDNLDNSPCTTSHTRSIFSSAEISTCCRFFSLADVTTPDQYDDVCTRDDKVCFLSALARCSKLTEIRGCPDIVSDLLNIPEIDPLEAEHVEIYEETPLTDMEYARLGAILENSVKVTSVELALPLANVPQAFCDSIANCIHIQSLSMSIFWFPTTVVPKYQDPIGSIFWSKMMPTDGNGPLGRLLRNPQNQLKELRLDATHLQDHTFMVIAQLMPSSHIEMLDVYDNHIQTPGLLEFARQLPKMYSLTKVELGDNPWEKSSPKVLQECGAALLHGFIENPSIQNMDGLARFPQYPLLCHYLCLNRSGRRLLTSPYSYNGKQPIPNGLWPRVLSRAGSPIEEGGPGCIPIIDKDGKDKYNGPANAVYYFLRNCPAIVSWQEKSIGSAGIQGTL